MSKIAADADGLILTGSITFHYFAGFTGGRKTFLPGIASKESIVANHKLTVSGEKGRGGTSMTGILDGNPVHEDMIEAVRFAKPAFLVNTITNAEGRIARFFCGNVETAHRDGSKKVMEVFSTKLKRKADMVVASCGGFPKDMNFIQAHKALHHAFQSVKEGGTLVLVAECSEGIGSEAFLPYFQLANSGQIRESLMQEYTLNGHTALATLDKAERCSIVLLSELDSDVVALMRMESAKSPEEVIEKATASLPEKSLVYVMPEAALTFVSNES
ncbi:MAG: nickel-dependent lactate racemase [Candidatus Eisenbacteria bacterium]|nr:nickel-dependent lactate racemase [Candidatus Eisenbacteria bacterium]